jgi:hypothetical protein
MRCAFPPYGDRDTSAGTEAVDEIGEADLTGAANALGGDDRLRVG